MGKKKTHSTDRFMGLPAALEEQAPYKVVLCPFEESTGYLKGTGDAPFSIVEQSKNIEPFDRELGINAASKGILTEVVDDPREIAFDGRFPVILGGEHLLTYHALKSSGAKDVLVLDAHLDLLEEYGGRKMAHATWLRRTVEEGVSARVVGARVGAEEEWKFAEDNGILGGLPEGKELYLSIDVDVLDIASMPCCSNPEPRGWSWEELHANLEEIFKKNSIVAVDIVEHNPCKNLSQFSYAVAALAYKCISLKEKWG